MMFLNFIIIGFSSYVPYLVEMKIFDFARHHSNALEEKILRDKIEKKYIEESSKI